MPCGIPINLGSKSHDICSVRWGLPFVVTEFNFLVILKGRLVLRELVRVGLQA